MPPAKKSTRSRILETARGLFWLNGYASTTGNEILARSDANPSSFYRLFKTKENVLLAVLNNSASLATRPGHSSLDCHPRPHRPHLGILNIYRNYLITSEFSCGSIIGKLALEIPENHLHIHQRLAASFDNWTAVIRQMSRRRPIPISRQPRSQITLPICPGHNGRRRNAIPRPQIHSPLRHLYPASQKIFQLSADKSVFRGGPAEQSSLKAEHSTAT
jgi:tetracycline repressor-like protein